MTISNHIKRQYFADEAQQLIRLAPSQSPPLKPTKRKGTPWTDDEHNRFLEALERFPAGPWKRIAEHVHTRTTRQTMTHAQRYREKIARRRRILRDAGMSTAQLSDDAIIVTTAAVSATLSTAATTEPIDAATTTTTTTAIMTEEAARASTSRSRSTRRSHSGASARSSIRSINNISSGGADADTDPDPDAIRDGGDNMFDGSDSDDGDGHDTTSCSDAFDAIDTTEFEDIEDEQLLLALVETYEPLPFSDDDARWLVEHYSSISLQTPL